MNLMKLKLSAPLSKDHGTLEKNVLKMSYMSKLRVSHSRLVVNFNIFVVVLEINR